MGVIGRHAAFLGNREFDFTNAFKFTVSMSAGEQMTIPATGSNSFTISWGDGNLEYVNYSSPSHVYVIAGEYQISIAGTMPLFSFNNGGNKLNVIGFEDWGDVGFISLFGGFYGCSNLTGSIPTSNIDKLGSSLTTVRNLFLNCNNLTGSIPTNFLDNAVNLTNVSLLFRGCSSLTGSIPTTFLDNCVNLTEAREVYLNCNNLTGSIPTTFLDNCVNLTTVQGLFFGCNNLTGSIPTTFLDNCINLTDVSGLFVNCTGLTGVIPTTFLDNAVSLTTVYRLFRGCTGLTGSIPTTFLDNCINLTDVQELFYSCTSLSGDAKDYWNNPQYTSFIDCYFNCTQLDNYADIPIDWK